MSPMDLAQRLVSHQRQLVSLGPSVPMAEPWAIASHHGGGGGGGDMKLSQLAERVSVLVAGLQRRSDADKQDMERQLEQVGARCHVLVQGLEARVAACEEKGAAQERRIDSSVMGERAAGEAVLALREVRAQFGNALSETQALCRAQHVEVQAEQREQLNQLEELAESVRHAASRVEHLEHGLGSQEQGCRRVEEQVQTLLRTMPAGPPPWFGKLESALDNVESRLNEQQVAVELQFGRLRAEFDGLRRTSEAVAPGLREDVLRAAEGLVHRELAGHRASAQAQVRAPPAPSGEPQAVREHGRRLDDVEGRVAAMRVRVDAHDGRFGSLSERVEGACEQAVEAAREVSAQQREELLSESDCNMRILRQRVDSLSELCEELMLRQAPRGKPR